MHDNDRQQNGWGGTHGERHLRACGLFALTMRAFSTFCWRMRALHAIRPGGVSEVLCHLGHSEVLCHLGHAFSVSLQSGCMSTSHFCRVVSTKAPSPNCQVALLKRLSSSSRRADSSIFWSLRLPGCTSSKKQKQIEGTKLPRVARALLGLMRFASQRLNKNRSKPTLCPCLRPKHHPLRGPTGRPHRLLEGHWVHVSTWPGGLLLCKDGAGQPS